MPAYGMAAPRSDQSQLNEAWRLSAPIANPSIGAAVTMDPASGPKGSPFDAKVYPSTIYQPVPADRVADANNTSTGALATGIGFGLSAGVSGGIDGAAGLSPLIGQNQSPPRTGNFGAGYQPGLTDTAGNAATDARHLYIGGGRSNIVVTGGDVSKGLSTVVPYSAVPICAFGMGGSRDGGAGPAFTGFGMKLAVAAADVAFGAAIETGFLNRQGVSDSKASAADVGVTLNGTVDATKNLLALWQFGSASAASAAPTADDPPGDPPTALAAKNGDEQKKIEKEFDAKLEKELEKKPQVTPPNHKK